MLSEQRARQTWLEAATICAAWLAYALITTWATVATAGRSSPSLVSTTLANNLFEALLWALATLAFFWLARRFPVERGRALRAIAIQGVGGALILMARLTVIVWVGAYVAWVPRPSFRLQFWGRLSQTLIFLVLLPGIAHAVLYYRRYRERERAAERLAAGLAVARLQALKMQLHPHFLFNTLNAISALIPAEAQPARRMVARLGDLLRIALDHEEAQEVTLREELAFLEPYLEIEQARLGERLTVAVNVDHDVLDARVPHLMLQPLVENAVRHGIAARIEPGTVRISARRGVDRESMELEIRDDGPGIARDGQGSARKGVGLGNIQSRLEQLYGREQMFEIRDHSEGGAVVRIRIPLRGRAASDVAARVAPE